METKAVFDTNIWISYFLGGKITELTEMVLFHEVSLYRAKELTNELKTVLSRKKFSKYLTLPMGRYLSMYENLTRLIEIEQSFEGCRDPKDNFLFDIAYQSSSDYLVSGDKDILETPIIPPLQVVTLSEFKKRI